ncbi:hypothetical protein [Vreelandella aquamarina]|uniref:hypothetical protein n=1 Tax=Vreelandella aquamarina TaxID=77097 RepID=UPI0038516D8F
MPRYSEERKAAILKKLLPPHNRSVASVATEEGISNATLSPSVSLVVRLAISPKLSPEGAVWNSCATLF